MTEVSTSFGNSPKKSLWYFYQRVEEYEYTDPERAYQLFDQILQDGLQHYTAPPDLWHNLASVAGRVRHRDVELQLTLQGLQEWPEDVDLLCDELQHRYTTHFDLNRAQEIWNKLANLDKWKTGSYWRFWVYGAIYHATYLNDSETGLQLLDEGLRFVKRDGLQNILSNYRRVLIDGAPRCALEDEKSAIKYQHQVLEILDKRYKLGIALGVENAYVLATDLAVLYQERAGASLDSAVSDHYTDSRETLANAAIDYLDTALKYLDLAEKLYAGNPNHPIWGIYEPRIRILMAQHRYGDAQKYLGSLPLARRRDLSMSTMLNLASRMTGQKEAEDDEAERANRILSSLFANEGEQLLRIARQDQNVALTLDKVLQKMQEG
jgi:hypothetical protein